MVGVTLKHGMVTFIELEIPDGELFWKDHVAPYLFLEKNGCKVRVLIDEHNCLVKRNPLVKQGDIPD